MGHLDELTAEELVMLGHALRLVPDNAVLTGNSALSIGGKGLVFFHECEPYKTLWAKVAAAISQREDVEPFRVRTFA